MISVGIGFVLGFAACYVMYNPGIISKIPAAVTKVVDLFRRK